MKIESGKKTIKKVKGIEIFVPIYNVTVLCFPPKVNKDLETLHGWKKITGRGQAVNRITDDFTVQVRFKDDSAPVLAHEMLHVVQFIMEWIGHTPDPEGDEPSAYLLTFLMERYKKLK